jgi:hypothetical protein
MPGRHFRFPARVMPLAWLAVVALLAWAGLARTAEGWRLEPLEGYIHAHWWGLPAGSLPARLEDWQPENADGRRWAAFSQAVLDAAERPGAPAASLAAKAEAAVERGLALAPAQPSAWARLALLRLNRDEHDGARAALVLSWRTGPQVRGLAWLRCRLALFLWDGLGEDGKLAAAGDLRQLWQQKPSAALPYPRQALVRFAHGIGRLDTVRDALPKGERALLAERIKSVLMEAAGAS